MATPSKATIVTDASGTGFDSAPGARDTVDWEQAIGHRRQPEHRSGWFGSRFRLLAVATVLCGLLLLVLAKTQTHTKTVDGRWRADDQGRLELTLQSDASARDDQARLVRGLVTESGATLPADSRLLNPGTRWLVSDEARALHARMRDDLTQAINGGVLQVALFDGSTLALVTRDRGLAGLGAMFWLTATLALLLCLVAMVVTLSWPSRQARLYALLAACQAGNLVFIALESLPGLGTTSSLVNWDFLARSAFDLIAGAAVVQATGIHPVAVPGRQVVTTATWMTSAALLIAMATDHLPNAWYWIQGAAIVCCLIGIIQLTLGYRLEPHPFAVVQRRFALAALCALLLLTLTIATADRDPARTPAVAAVGSLIWYIAVATLLLLLPMLVMQRHSRAKRLLREFALVAVVTTVATSLDMMISAIVALDRLTSLTLVLFLSLGLYAGLRHWVMNQMMGSNTLTAERMFEHLYRIAREVQARPQCVGERLEGLLRELFVPLEMMRLGQAPAKTRIVGEGSTLIVPIPALRGASHVAKESIVLRYARQGKRMFTAEDALLTDGVVEQLQHAVAFDEAVEQGRREERTRIAQDLHDDIGARLLTLMYQAQTREMEEYLRHTLQDLKTLTRGLATGQHYLSHAMVEWKADISQRLSATQCELGWSFTTDRDILLSIGQWSALTRILRELVTNAIAHAQATRVDVEGAFEQGALTLTVNDNGGGKEPLSWSHGLGLGGVRKRVKQLGGSVEWIENNPCGIRCRVHIPVLSDRV